MLHRADSLYHSGRSDDLLKLKPWQDAEATVIEILPGKGKFSGMMGALVVKDKRGHIFRIGSGFSDNERRNPPQPGSVIHTNSEVLIPHRTTGSISLRKLEEATPRLTNIQTE